MSLAAADECIHRLVRFARFDCQTLNTRVRRAQLIIWLRSSTKTTNQILLMSKWTDVPLSDC